MAELATIARPYAEALFAASAGQDADDVAAQLGVLAGIAADPALRHFAGHPKVADTLVFNVVADVLGRKRIELSPQLQNFLHAVLDNGRLGALPEIAQQFQLLHNERSGVADAAVYSAFPIDAGELAGVVAALEKRFKRRLKARVEIDSELIGGIRVVVGDEVLDTSVKARLQQMKATLTA